MKKINFIGRYTAIFLSVLLLGTVITSCKEDDKDVVKPKTITDVIMTNSQFSILKEIIVATGLSDALRTENVTLFAPDDAAFKSSQITSAMVNALDTTAARAFVLKHTLKGTIKYGDLKEGNFLGYIKGDTIKVAKASKTDTTLLLNGKGKVITKNVNANNGIIQVVDKVLVPIK